MGGLAYVTLMRLKNQVKSMFKSPAKIIYLVLFTALFVFVLLSGSLNSNDADHVFRDKTELAAIVVALLLAMTLLLINNGFVTGASLFKMPDVNFVFTGPFRPSRVLFYGLFQQLGNSLIMGFFILFQYAWMRSVYGATLEIVLIILVAYALSVFTSQLVALLIYSATAGSDRLRKIARIIYIAIPAGYAVAIFITLMGADNMMAALADFAVSLPMRLFPIAGWLGGAVAGIILAEPSYIIMGFGIWAAALIALCAIVVLRKHDYYEFVLQSTETTHATQEQAKEGQLTETAPRRLRMGKEGLGGGFGASVFYYKHMLENRRTRKFVLSGTSFMFILIVVGFAYFARGGGLVSVIAMSTYMQVFSIAMGRLSREMTKPYLYLVPEPPFRKLLWCIRESLLGYTIEAVLIYVPVSFMFGLGVPELIACILLRLTFSYLIVAGNLLSERIFGHITTKGLILLFYFVVLIVLCLPGAALAIFISSVGFEILSANFTICIIMTVVNIPIALLLMYLCRNILDTAELRN